MGNAEGRRGSFLVKKEAGGGGGWGAGRGIVTADLPAGAVLARLSGKGDRSPLWPPLGVRHSFAHPPLGREGRASGQ